MTPAGGAGPLRGQQPPDPLAVPAVIGMLEAICRRAALCPRDVLACIFLSLGWPLGRWQPPGAGVSRRKGRKCWTQRQRTKFQHPLWPPPTLKRQAYGESPLKSHKALVKA